MTKQNFTTGKSNKNAAKAKPAAKKLAWYANPYLAAVGIAALAFILFLPSLGGGFVYDDEIYIVTNNLIKNFNFAGIKGIFGGFFFGNYHPVTLVSLAFDYSLYGMEPWGYHLSNIIFHSLSVFLMFVFCFKLSKNIGAAAVAAILFAVHPLHVESAAWAADRKDLLCGLFFLLALISYLEYLKPKKENYLYLALCFIFFLMSTMSKAVAVVLPALLVLIDFYLKRKINLKSIALKLPFFILALVFGLTAISAQRELGALNDSPAAPVYVKIILLFYSIFFYIFKMIVPADLSANYSAPVYPGGGLLPIAYFAPAVIIGLAIFAFAFYKYSGKPAFSLLFYLLCILPVLQLMPVGNAFTADRFFYIPSIGLFYGIGEGYRYLSERKKLGKPLLIAIFSAIALILCALTYNRISVWKDEMSLFADVSQKNPGFALSYNNIGNVNLSRKMYDSAIFNFKKSISLNPKYTDPYYNLGNAYQSIGRHDSAIAAYKMTVSVNPKHIQAYHNMGISYQATGKYDSAYSVYMKIISINPNFVSVYNSLGVFYFLTKDYAKAAEYFKKTISMDPAHADAYKNLGVLSLRSGDNDKASEYFRSSARLGSEDSRKWLRAKGMGW